MKKKINKLEEIDLIDLILSIWIKKNILIVVTFIFGIIGYLLSQQTTERYDIYLKFSKIDYEKERIFHNLNSIGNYKIDKNILFDLFYFQIQDYENIIYALRDDSYINPKDYISNDKYNQALYSLADNFKIRHYDEIMEWEIIYEGDNSDLGKIENILKKIFIVSNNEVKDFIIEDFQRQHNIEKKIKRDKINTLNLEMEGIKEDFYSQKKSLMGLLKTQYQIAKNLNIEKNILTTENSVNNQNIDGKNSNILNIFNVTNSYYLRGFLNIDQEIKQLETLEFDDDINNLYLSVNNKKERLKNNTDLRNSLDAFLDISFNKEFKSVNFDINKIQVVKKSNNRLKIFSLFILIGISLSTIFILIINKKKS